MNLLLRFTQEHTSRGVDSSLALEISAIENDEG